ncbi:hypothetical protein JDV02_008271 [Purpureocillium takamizusanense]|uniref:Methyltransferase type 11 domain-containing protein n=1 Tax=Purpureocillium takamizusanense TaxID=2060973 RepID=A0A9Q8QNG2_9HYPO|nr:uncharacterized protein JDV02_008271 [Purpureocillium takamizusanense]UNI22376.1 hypothetical protein JDV02_008271 [Purpureocillium takamizusanense]
MASRTGYGLPARPSDGYRPARRAEGPRMGIPRPTHPATGGPSIPAPQFKSSIPHPGVRRTGLPQVSKSGSQPSSWGSASRTSAESRSHAQSGSGSSSSGRSYDEPRLRQAEPLRAFKGPNLGGARAYHRNDSTSTTSSKRQSLGSNEPGLGIQFDSDITASPSQIHTAEMVDIRKSATRSTVYPELDRYREFRRPDYGRHHIVDVPFRLATHDLPPPTPGSAVFSGSSSQISAISGSPSTKYSESPGPGPYSRDTTPTSMSSQSPVLVAPIRVAAPLRLRQNSPAVSRPPVTRRRAGSTGKAVDSDQGLAAVRESMASSSSNSTVRDGDKNKKRDKKPRLPPPPPSPPPRKSSQKFRKNKDASAQPEIASSRTNGESTNGLGTSPKVGPPPRPSRDGTPDMQSQLFEPVPVIQSNLVSWERRGSEPVTIRSLPGSTTSLPQMNKNASTPHLPTATETRPRTAQKQGGSSSRFLFFGRKKAPGDVDQKGARKGPVAGTGHEGYGRVGAVRRRSASKNDPKSSQDSLVSDSFLADRVNPVVIAGGEVVENRNPSAELARVGSNQSALGRPSMDSKASASNIARTTLWPSAMPRGTRRPSDSSSTDSGTMQSTLAFRRSVQRLGSPGDPLKLPHPIITNAGPISSPMTSFDTSILSEESHLEMQKEISREGDVPKKLQKRPQSPRKWNLFSRSQRSQRPKPKSEPVEAAVVSVEKKPIPFYAMMESEQEEDLDVQEALRRADVYAASPALPEQTEPLFVAPAQQIVSDGVSGAEANIGRLHPVPEIARPSRLPQVGRIPQVVKQRPELQSFSRPFRASMQAPPAINPIYDPYSIAKGPTPPRPSTPACEAGEAPKDPSKLSPEVTRGEREFLAFSPRKNSDITIGTSSSSSGPSFMATAIIPKPDDPPAEDEVWDEYNDLLGDDKVPQSATSSKDPFHLETYHTKLARDKPLDSPVVPEGRKEPQSKPTSSTYSADMTERIRKAFQPHLSPAATDAKAESKRNSASSGRTVFSDCSAASDDASPLAQVNLRVGSMTVSKWLTFGHVLFSDIRHELAGKDAPRQSIVVIDSLGNDDWSFYAAETYPAASFYNLSPRAPLPAAAQSPTSFPLSPPNHHQVQYMSHRDRFPFAAQSFDCMVYRFPSAGSESQYRNIVNEARRVLRPGAFIELSILDVDLNNMGNRGRRTVRRLKEQIHEQANDTSLASVADLMVRLLGKAGFTNIKAARVGVPVASSITRTESKETDAKAKDASLADMMKDNSPMADANITKIVTRVGRWWYTRCYENAAGPANSIWADRALLSECETFGTSLKLMVCCARAPDRIVSF